MRRTSLAILPFLLLTGCAAAATIAAEIAKNAPLICPEFSVLPGGAQVCSGLAVAVEGFLNWWAESHPASATAAYVKAVKAGAGARASGARLVRVGTVGLFPADVAAELKNPEMAKALEDWIKAHPATTADAGAPTAAR